MGESGSPEDFTDPAPVGIKIWKPRIDQQMAVNEWCSCFFFTELVIVCVLVCVFNELIRVNSSILAKRLKTSM